MYELRQPITKQMATTTKEHILRNIIQRQKLFIRYNYELNKTIQQTVKSFDNKGKNKLFQRKSYNSQ